LLRELTEKTLPDSQEIADEVAKSVRQMEIKEYGRERLAAGPAVEESEEITVVEGRADVLNLLKHGIKNAIAMNGTSVPETIKELSKRKILTVFVDGDRGGDLIIRELLETTEVDFICKAPDGKEVEEITKKEIHKALRGKITAEQAKLDLKVINGNGPLRKKIFEERRQLRRPIPARVNNNNGRFNRPVVRRPAPVSAAQLSPEEKTKLKSTMEDLFGTRGACIFDEKLNILGKVPISELLTTIKSVQTGIYAIVLDGDVDGDLVKVAGNLKVKHVVGSEVKTKDTYGVNVLDDSKL